MVHFAFHRSSKYKLSEDTPLFSCNAAAKADKDPLGRTGLGTVLQL